MPAEWEARQQTAKELKGAGAEIFSSMTCRNLKKSRAVALACDHPRRLVRWAAARRSVDFGFN